MPIDPLRSSSMQSPARRASDAFLTRNNPKTAQLVASTPGLGLFLDRNSVSAGPRPGDVETQISWGLWNHSEATSRKYGHGMKDDQIKSDVIVVFQPSSDPAATVSFGGQRYPGREIIGVYRLGDQVTGVSGVDGGFLGQFQVTAHGKAGDRATIAWAVVSIGPDGRVRGGGFPTTSGGKPVPYQQNQHGGEYHGRAAEVVHGARSYVPVTDA